jgi:hypothetical protein
MINSRIVVLTATAIVTLLADGMSVDDSLNHHDSSAQAPCVDVVKSHSPPPSRDSSSLVRWTIPQWQLKSLIQNGVGAFGQARSIRIAKNPDGTVTFCCTELQWLMLEKALKSVCF